MDTFGANDANKTATKNMYWQWKLETGTTQDEIDSNDLLDSEWMGDEIILGIQATGRQVMENPSTEYTVTFDLNGGKLANHGDSTQVTKQVKYGEAYGTLPTPTREGYEFKGWNGNNKFDMSMWLSSFSTATNGTVSIQDSSVTLTATQNDAYTDSYSRESAYRIPVKPNTNYILSWKSNNIINGYQYVFINNKYTSNYMFYATNAIQKYLSFVTPEDASYINVRVGVNQAGNSITYSNIQVEEGTTVTAYEPYYITSSTEVVQNQNHTLTAIWEPISN